MDTYNKPIQSIKEKAQKRSKYFFFIYSPHNVFLIYPLRVYICFPHIPQPLKLFVSVVVVVPFHPTTSTLLPNASSHLSSISP